MLLLVSLSFILYLWAISMCESVCVYVCVQQLINEEVRKGRKHLLTSWYLCLVVRISVLVSLYLCVCSSLLDDELARVSMYLSVCFKLQIKNYICILNIYQRCKHTIYIYSIINYKKPNSSNIPHECNQWRLFQCLLSWIEWFLVETFLNACLLSWFLN